VIRWREIIGSYLLKNKKSAAINRPLIAAKDAKTAAILYPYEAINAKEHKNIQDFFLSWGIEPYFYIFLDEKKEETPPSQFKKEYFNQLHLDFWYIPKMDYFAKFTDMPFDYLINLDTKGVLPLQALAFHSKAQTRMAKKLDQWDFCNDFLMDTETQNAYELFNLITAYIK